MAGTPNGDRLSELSSAIVDQMMRHYHYMATGSVQEWQNKAASLCTSEIERLFLVAYWAFKELQTVCGHCQLYRLEIIMPKNQRERSQESPIIPFDKVVLDPSCLASRYKRFFEEEQGAGDLDFLWPQQPIGPYRADFALCRARLNWGDECPDVEYIETVVVSVPVVIECDGHDYHERTKKQAQHDRERDRYMQASGFRVMRFTGSELYRDPMKCAEELDKFLSSRESVAKEQYLSLL